MSRVMKRLYASRATSSASEAAAEILQRFGDKPVSVREQLFDANQVRLLSLTLGRPALHGNGPLMTEEGPKEGTPVPPGYHLVYFLPTFLENDLGRDGTDRTVNPLAPYTRRMWAGGELRWNQDPISLLRVGQTVRETTKITSAEAKQTKNGGSLIIAGLEKTFETNKGVALVDRRNWVFQKEITEARDPPPKPEEKAFPNGEYTRDFCQTDITLFRMSALTFNAHKIHYSKEWCRAVEGHRDCVVHGPINLLGVLDMYRDFKADGSAESVPKSISYRAQSPFYVHEPYRIVLNKDHEGGEKRWKAEIYDLSGKVGVKATVVE